MLYFENLYVGRHFENENVTKKKKKKTHAEGQTIILICGQEFDDRLCD